MSGGAYVGGELSLFEKAVNWKSYWSRFITPYVTGVTLEVGAGNGANTKVLSGTGFQRWVCLEPDRDLLRQIPGKLPNVERYSFVAGTLSDLDPSERFDTILYIDVMEHIADDRGEMARACDRLNSEGTLIILAPAHPWLFTPFDQAIGHFRRYTKESLKAIAPTELKLERLIYLDCAGLLASCANRIILHQSMPTERQILTWDRFLAPVSMKLDGLLGYTVGKTVVGIWRRLPEPLLDHTLSKRRQL